MKTPDREKVINGLEHCGLNKKRGCVGCSYSDECGNFGRDAGMSSLATDALAMLREQEPRMMTLEEVETLPYGYVLIETDKQDSLRWLDALLFSKNANFSFDFITLEGRARLLGTEYNREWRCWTARPTNAQREAVEWGC